MSRLLSESFDLLTRLQDRRLAEDLRASISLLPAALAVRAGDLMRVGDALRAALALCELAIATAETAGASALRTAALRRLVADLLDESGEG